MEELMKSLVADFLFYFFGKKKVHMLHRGAPSRQRPRDDARSMPSLIMLLHVVARRRRCKGGFPGREMSMMQMMQDDAKRRFVLHIASQMPSMTNACQWI